MARVPRMRMRNRMFRVYVRRALLNIKKVRAQLYHLCWARSGLPQQFAWPKA